MEQEWAYINLAALSTREMGPGARHSALDDSWGGWNWRKLLGLGKSDVFFCTRPSYLIPLGSLLEANLTKAKEMASVQRKAAGDFTATFPETTIHQWKRMVQEWEANPSCPNPYVSNDRGRVFVLFQVYPILKIVCSALKISEIRLRLAQEEIDRVGSGEKSLHQISPSVFIRMGLELEDQQ